jgi:GTPase SAR1 family protein
MNDQYVQQQHVPQSLRRPTSATRRAVPTQQTVDATNNNNNNNKSSSSGDNRRRITSVNQQQSSFDNDTKTLWDIVKKKNKKRISFNNALTGTTNIKELSETNVLLLGPEGSGKTSLIYRIMQKDFRKDAPPASVGLEYRFRKKEDNFKTFIVNFWELSGGRMLADLLDELITPENIHSFVVIITIDLSHPQQCFSDVIFFINKINSIAKNCFKSMSQFVGTDFTEKIVDRQRKKFGEKHSDLKDIYFIGIPIVICATHYESFQMNSPNELATMNQCLRFLSHKFAASLIYMSSLPLDNNNKNNNSDFSENVRVNETFDKSFRSLMNYYIFGSMERQLKCIDKMKPVRILAGRDSLEEIGKVIVNTKSLDVSVREKFKEYIESNMTSFQVTDVNQIEMWYSLFVEHFGYENVEEKAKEQKQHIYDLIAEEYKEPAIDSIRAQKDEELLHYRKMMAEEQKKRMQQRRTAS